MDGQSVKSTAVPGVRGYDAGKKVNVRKRHVLVDTLGLLLAVVVTAASVQDRDAARQLLGHLPGCCKKLRNIWVDGDYSGGSLEWVAERFRFCPTTVVPCPQGKSEIRPAAPSLDGGAHVRLAEPFPTAEQKLRAPPD